MIETQSTSPAGPAVNGTALKYRPIELAIDLPHNLGIRIHLHLTILETSLILFLTSAAIDGGQSGAAMGSFVYAIPDRYNPRLPLSTALYTASQTVDFNTRMAKMLVRRTNKLCYVGGSINLSHMPQGGSVEEEVEAFRAIVSVVTERVGQSSTTDQ